MLCQFSVKNFKSYRDETIFDFQATAVPEFANTLITFDKADALLPVGVIYGPNGGGKTNLLQALACLLSTVVKPINNLEKNIVPFVLQQNVSAVPFLFDDSSADEPTEFQIYFRTQGYEYKYYIALKQEEVVEEELARKKLGGKKPAILFKRKIDTLTLGPILKKENLNIKVNPKMPYLSFLSINYDLDVISPVQQWFESCVIRNYANPIVEQQIMFTEKPETKNRIVALLNDMGIDISDYRYDDEKQQLYVKRLLHNHPYELDFNSESDGTRKLIAALPVLLIALAEGRLVVIDELDAKLHPKLLRYLIALFKNKEVNQLGAQIMFTSHDMATMKNSVFRRDEIWFAAENADHASELYSLYEIRREDNERINNTAAYDKQYLEGRYGADPYLQNMRGSGWK